MPTELAIADSGTQASSATCCRPGAADRKLRHASKTYTAGRGGAPAPVIILDDISLEVREGEMLALLGQSGSRQVVTILRLMAVS